MRWHMLSQKQKNSKNAIFELRLWKCCNDTSWLVENLIYFSPSNLYNLAGRENNYLALGLCNIVLYSTNASYYKLSPDCKVCCWGLKTNRKYSFMNIIPFTHKFDLITFKTVSSGNHTFSSWVTFVTSIEHLLL